MPVLGVWVWKLASNIQESIETMRVGQQDTGVGGGGGIWTLERERKSMMEKTALRASKFALFTRLDGD
jgi:hypothetical protein